MPSSKCPNTTSGDHLPILIGVVTRKGVRYKLYNCGAGCGLEWTEEDV